MSLQTDGPMSCLEESCLYGALFKSLTQPAVTCRIHHSLIGSLKSNLVISSIPVAERW